MPAIERFDHWVQTAYATTPSSLGLYRIAFALVILTKALPQGLWVSSFPNSFFNPPVGPTFFFFHGFPSAIFFYALNGLLVFVAVCLLFGYWTRSVSVAFSIGFMFLQAWEYSFGKINHEFMVVLIPILFAWAGWGNAWSVDSSTNKVSPSATNPIPVSLFAFTLSIMMLSAGLPKITSGWLNPHTHAVLSYVVISHFTPGLANWVTKAALGIRSGWFWEPLDWLSCAIEIAFICTFIWRTALRFICALITIFHFGIALLLRIYSWANVLSYGAIADWDEMVEFFPYSLVLRLARRIAEASRTGVLTIAGFVTAVYLFFGNPLFRLVSGTPDEADFRIGTALVTLAAITGIVFLFRRIRRIYIMNIAQNATSEHPLPYEYRRAIAEKTPK